VVGGNAIAFLRWDRGQARWAMVWPSPCLNQGRDHFLIPVKTNAKHVRNVKQPVSALRPIGLTWHNSGGIMIGHCLTTA
jgi:hypothetical protein